MDQFCDLHTHSNYSDGTLSPAALVTAAEQIGLAAIALTDHNTVAGLPSFLEAGEQSPVETIPGAEFSTDYLDIELHIVGLFISPEYYQSITELTSQMQQRKHQSNLDLIAALNTAGYKISYDAIKATMPEGEPNRAHIAAELTRLGYTASNKEAFKTLLGTGCGYYQPPKRIDVFEMIAFLRSIGAVPVLAHPFLSFKQTEDLRLFLQAAVDCGLQGMETHYSTFSPEQTQVLTQLSEHFQLSPSGGSDFHGENKPDICLGTGKGDLQVPISFLNNLKTRSRPSAGQIQ